jgi:hypothetical protein
MKAEPPVNIRLFEGMIDYPVVIKASFPSKVKDHGLAQWISMDVELYILRGTEFHDPPRRARASAGGVSVGSRVSNTIVESRGFALPRNR